MAALASGQGAPAPESRATGLPVIGASCARPVTTMISETQFEHQLRIARADALTMRVLYLRRVAERLRWLVQQTEESGNVERAKRFARELAKTEAKRQKTELERANAW